MLQYSTLIDNSSEQLSMVSAVRGLLCDARCNTLKIATGYWDIPGTSLLVSQLKEFLQREDAKLQILIGTDPVVRSYQQKNPKYKDAHTQKDFIQCDLQNLEVKDEYVETVRMLKEYCLADFDSSRIQIKMCKTNADGEEQFFHAKCYIFLGVDYAKGIVGSSNFTQKGLEGNSELNYLEWNNQNVAAVPGENSYAKGHKYWFDEKWEQSDEWNKIFLEEVLNGTKIAEEADKPVAVDTQLTPYELYIKVLSYKLGSIVDYDQQKLIESYLPKNFNPLDYQIEAVKQCFTIMKEHGGFMLADVVGLGKTIVGTLIIKHFLTLPNDDNEEMREKKVLIVTPPAIKSAWKNTIAQFDKEATVKMKDDIDFITTGSIGNLLNKFDTQDADNEKVEGYDEDLLKEEIEKEDVDTSDGDFSSELEHKNYGLIIIDESHKFRNSTTSMYQSLTNLIGEIGSNTGLYPYIGLLSATPQNNRPSDLQNQIYLFERNVTDSTLKKANGGNLESFFGEINRKYKSLIAIPHDEEGNVKVLTDSEKEDRKKELKEISEKIRSCVLEDILVRRTRTDIIKYYKGNIQFPKISGPHGLEYRMEEDMAKLFAQTMDIIASPQTENGKANEKAVQYYRYRAIEYLKDPSVKKIYQYRNLSAERISNQLANIMQILLVKRLESSFPAFKNSLRNLKQSTENMIEMWENDTIFICPDIDVNKELNKEKYLEKDGRICTFEECADDIRKKIKKLNDKKKNDKHRNREVHRSDFNPDYIKLLQKDKALIEMLSKRWDVYDYDPKLETFKESLKPVLFDQKTNKAQKLVIFSEAKDTVDAISRTISRIDKNLNVLTITAQNRAEKEHIIRENFDANYDGEQKNDYQVIVTTEVLAEGINLHRANCILNYDTPWNATRLMQRIGRVNRIGSTADTVYVYNFMPSSQGDAQIQLVQKAYTKLQSFHTLFGEDSQVFTSDEEVMHYDLNQQVNGDESPMQKYINELKNYKTANPARYQQITEKTEDLKVAVQTMVESNAYFLIRTPKLAGMFAKVGSDGQAEILSSIDMFEQAHPEVTAMRGELPVDYNSKQDAAIRAVQIAIDRATTRKSETKEIEQAKDIVHKWLDKNLISEKSKRLIQQSYKLVKNGNADIIKKIIKIDEMNDGSYLFSLTPEQVDEVLEGELAKLVERVEKKTGKAEVYMALCK